MVSEEKLVVVHPHQLFDWNVKSKFAIDEILDNFSGTKEDIHVLQGFAYNRFGVGMGEKRTMPLYLSTDRQFQISPSQIGEMTDASLSEIVMGGVEISLMGGHLGICHRRAFEAILRYAQLHDVQGVSVSLPLDACYVGVVEKQRVGISGVLAPKRFIELGGVYFEVGDDESYTLRELASTQFSESKVPFFGGNEVARRTGRHTNEPGLIRKNLGRMLDFYLSTPDNPIEQREMHIGSDKVNIIL